MELDFKWPTSGGFYLSLVRTHTSAVQRFSSSSKLELEKNNNNNSLEKSVPYMYMGTHAQSGIHLAAK